MKPISLSRVTARTHRLISSRFPTIGVFDDLDGLEPEDIRFAFELEMATNARETLPQQRLQLLPEDQYVTGETATIVMAAFLHTSEAGVRFNDTRLGAWYASLQLETAIGETIYHHKRRLQASDGGFPATFQHRQLLSDVDCDLIELRGKGDRFPELYHTTDYSSSQQFAAFHRWPEKSNFAIEKAKNGVVFESSRVKNGENICLWSPLKVGMPIVQGAHLQYNFDRQGQVSVTEMKSVKVPV